LHVLPTFMLNAASVKVGSLLPLPADQFGHCRIKRTAVPTRHRL
jgi:hypothetical protein